MPAVLGIAFFLIPVFTSFIMLAKVSVPGVNTVPLPLTYGLLALVLGLAAVALPAVLRERGSVPLLMPLLMWLSAVVVSSALGFDPASGALFTLIFAFGVLWHVAVTRFYPVGARVIYPALLISGALASVVAIVMVVTKVPAAQYTVGHGRAIGTFILPGELAGYLLIYLPLVYAAVRISTRRWVRIAAICGLAAGSVAFVLTFSRAGEIGMVAAVSFLVLTQARGGGRIRAALAVVVAAGALMLFAFNAHHNPSENYTRLSIWQAAIGIIERFPLTGVGLFQFAKIYALVRLPDGEPTAFHAHSFLLTIAAELGLAGLAAVLFTWWRFIVELRARLAVATPAARALALAIAAGLVGTWVQGLIDTVSVVIFGMWMPFMALALCGAERGLAE